MRSLAKIYSVRSIARDCEVLLSSQPRSRKQLFRKGVAQLRYSGIPKTLRSRGATSSKNRFLAYTFCHPGRSAAKIRDPVHRSASAAGKGSRLLDPCLRRDDKAGLEAGIAIATTFLQIIQDCCAPIQHPEINSRSWRDLFQNRFAGALLLSSRTERSGDSGLSIPQLIGLGCASRQERVAILLDGPSGPPQDEGA